MTTILKELRALNARRESGDLSAAEYDAERAAILHHVEDVEPHVVQAAPPRPVRPTVKTGSSAIGFSIVVCLGVMSVCIAFSLLFLSNLNLALTLGVTILAAVAVALLQMSDE